MKKKICFIIPSLGGGGAEKVALNLLNNLNLDKYELHIILTLKEGEYINQLRSEVKVYILNKLKVRNAILEIIKRIKKIKPDIVLTFTTHLNIIVGICIAPFFKKKIKFISREINILSEVKLNFIRKLLLKIAYKNSIKIISQSNDMSYDLKSYLNIESKKIDQIPNFIDCIKIDQNLKSINNTKISTFKNILCVGRLEKQKGFDLLIRSFSKIEQCNYMLNIVGKGSEEESLKKLCVKYKIEDKVKFLGFKENPYINMKNADLFILSSRYEGFPNVLLEAGYCGLYSIVNNCKGGIKEIINNDVIGEVIDITNSKELEQALIKFEQKKIERNKISKIIEERYSSKNIVSKYENIFDKISF
ncbi:MAG: glycosyltransferase [Cetobacterium sp.]|uniref:glycosyltransferase n=1 Tax=Cetobacterium sp. TaxID=2071632 RepID=UPI003AA274CF